MKNTLITCQGIIFRRERLGCSLNDQKVFCGFQKHLLTGVLGEDFWVEESYSKYASSYINGQNNYIFRTH